MKSSLFGSLPTELLFSKFPDSLRVLKEQNPIKLPQVEGSGGKLAY